MTEERKHAKYSPSTLAILEVCPMWRSDQQYSDAARRGTEIGEQLATYAITGVIPKNPDDALLFGMKVMDEIAPAFRPELKAEPLLETGLDDTWGYADLIHEPQWEDSAYLWEVKTGWGDRREAKDNIQVMSYALSLLRKYSVVGASLLELDKKKVSRAEFQLGDAPRIIARINDIKSAAESATFKQAKTGGQCKYCLHKEICPEFSLTCDTAVAILKGNNPQALTPAQFATELSSEQLGKVLKRVLPLFAIAEDYVGHLKSRAIQILSAGGDVPGFKITERAGKKVWIDEMEAGKELTEAFPNRMADLLTLITPTQAEKVLGKEGKKIIESLTERQAPSKILKEE